MIFIQVVVYRPRKDCHEFCVRVYALFQLLIHEKFIYPVTVFDQLTYKESTLFPLLKFIHVRYLSCELPVGHVAHVAPLVQSNQAAHVGQSAQVNQSIQLFHVAHCGQAGPVFPVGQAGHVFH